MTKSLRLVYQGNRMKPGERASKAWVDAVRRARLHVFARFGSGREKVKKLHWVGAFTLGPSRSSKGGASIGQAAGPTKQCGLAHAPGKSVV